LICWLVTFGLWVLGDAYALFGGMRKRNPASNSVMVGGFAKVGDYMTYFGTFKEIIRCGVWLDNYTMLSVIRACRDITDLQMGRLIHVIAWKYNLELDHFVELKYNDNENIFFQGSVVFPGGCGVEGFI
jgi:hypothetical protein